MSTDQPNNENEENVPVENVELSDVQEPGSAVSEPSDLSNASEGTNPEVVEKTISDEAVENVAANADEAVAAVSDSEEEGSAVPQLTLGEGGEESAEADEEERPYVEPKIRGRIDKFGTAMGTGRRKTAVARVRIKEGSGEFVVNGRPMEEFFCIERDRKMVKAPLVATEEEGKVDVWVRVHGGGITGQTGAVVLGIARALQVKNPENHHALADGGYLTRDGRMVERKKYGQAKARKSFQFSKR